ncbi:MAG: DNA-processing protein DprA [Kiritimatiellae bacterium]|nr:DNA-processing protein DprA [Kiritimatiellia bacterium]MDD4736612.1 DNA-processing protein DprA [Kiritimatiellia bacterium]
MNAREAYIGLNMITQLGPVRIRALVEYLGSPEAVFQASHGDLCGAKGVGARLADAVCEQRGRIRVDREIAAAESLGARIITWVDEEYPESLRTIYDPPVALYVKGSLQKKDRHSLALVGSRRCTHYGLRTADRFAYQLAKVGYTVNSGLARGIDTAAHQGALKGGGRTLAVLGGALDRLYPEENRKLADEIARQGAVLSEFPLGREPDKTTFPYRNRVVSGLSLGVLVVESPRKSGSLITADMALEQGRQVFAVPGRIDEPASQGCHRLIRQGAKLVETLDDILEEFEQLLPAELVQSHRAAQKRPDVVLSAEEARVVAALGAGSSDMDTLARSCGMTSAALSGLMLGLEMKRVVRPLPGRRIELCVQAGDLRE